MGPIEVAIFSEHKTLISEGLNSALLQIKEVKLCDIDFKDPLLHKVIKKEALKIIFFVVKDLENSHYEQIISLNKSSPTLSILIISIQITRDSIFKGIRCGAQGFYLRRCITAGNPGGDLHGS